MLVSVSGSLVSKHAAMSFRAEFLAPETGIVPFSFRPPVIFKLSIRRSYSAAHGERKAQLRQDRNALNRDFDKLSNIDMYRIMTGRNFGFEPGDVVAIPFGIGLSHYGIVTAQGTVISNSRKHGGVVEQGFADFANGKRVRLCERTDPLSGAIAETRARRAKGKSYRPTESNCVHFSRWSHRQKPTSIQIASATSRTFADLVFGHRR